MLRTLLRRVGLGNTWSVELLAAALALAAGAVLLPVLIFYVGAATLGRYEGASLGRQFSTLYTGLGQGSTACWIVLLGPYGFYLLLRALGLWWRGPAAD